MSTISATDAIGEATSALVGAFDLTDVLARLMISCADVLEADAAGLVVRTSSGNLELLAASSHRATELEIYQVQQDDGPCVDCIHLGDQVSSVGSGEIDARWPGLHGAIGKAGFEMVHAVPLNWRAETLGGLNIFRARTEKLSQHEVILAKTFADVATLALLQAPELTPGEVSARMVDAMRGRVVIEQAKGALSHAWGSNMEQAYQGLLRFARAEGLTLTAAADRVLNDAVNGSLMPM